MEADDTSMPRNDLVASRPRALTSPSAVPGRPLIAAACFLLLWAAAAGAQDLPNVPRTPGTLLAGPIAPEQGRTAIVAWHGDRVVSVPETAGSQPGADLQMRVVSLADLDATGPSVTVVPTRATGFHAHGYYQTGPYLFVGPHCLSASLEACNGTFPHDVWGNAFRVGGTGTPIGDSQLRRADIDAETGLLLGSVQRAGAQSPWGLNDFWTYSPIGDPMWLGVRRDGAWVYDWSNGGAAVGPAIRASWDHLGLTGVTGFPFIVGNILIVASDQAGSGVATYDISDLSQPVLLDVLKESNPGGYWPEIYGHYIFFPRRDGEGGIGSSAGFMVVDFQDPTNLEIVANRNLPGSNQYVTFQDEFAFMNRYKIDMRTFEVVLELETVPGLIDASQFALPVGNLVVTGGYGSDGPGLAVFAQQAEPDTRGPFVAYHVPRPDQSDFSIDCPITLSIPETLRTETIVDGVSLVLRPVGGEPVPTWHAFSQGKLLTVTPHQPLAPNTTYELLLTSGIEDAAGNSMEPYSFRFATGGGVVGGNAAPIIDDIAVDPAEPEPGDSISFSWSGSDAEGDAVEFRIDFGDGTPRTAWSADLQAAHVYAEAGHYQVTVQARDPFGALSATTRRVAVVAEPAAPGATASSNLALEPVAGRLYTANPDNDSVTAVDLASATVAWETVVAARPTSVALAPDGTVWVTCRSADVVVVLDGETGAVLASLPVAYGSAPVAVVPVPDAGAMLVSLEGTGRLLRFDVATRTQSAALALGPTPRAIAVTADGSRALVTRFLADDEAGFVYDVALAGAMSLTRVIRLEREHGLDGPASGRGVPNYLTGIRITPDGSRAMLVAKKDNTTRGTFFAPTMLPGQDTTVRAVLRAIDLTTHVEDRSLRLDLDNSDSPSAIAFSRRGDYAFIALQGNDQVAVVDMLDLARQDSPGTIHSRWPAGAAPQGVLVDDVRGLVVGKNFLDRTVTIFDAQAFLGAGTLGATAATLATVAAEKLHPTVLHGKRIFYGASDPRMSAEGYISCATCHLDGGHDGRTWDFTHRGEGFRNTIDLRGRSGTAHGNVHWSANFDEIQDFENDIRAAFGGSGFLGDADFAATSDPLGAPKAGRAADLDALAAYVSSLGPGSLPRSPGGAAASEAAGRGQAVFVEQGCASCHVPQTDYSDRLLHDVGTIRASSGGRLGGHLPGIETPTLLGLHATAPYLHDGSAATLEDVFTATGGRLAQAETGAMTGAARAVDLAWFPMKEWHAGQYVEIAGAGAVAFADVETTGAGPGYVEVRYSVLYQTVTMMVAVNGGEPTPVVLPVTPNEPSYVPSAWRRVRVPVSFASGSNSVVLSRAAGGTLAIDDVLLSTPDAAARAAAHVRSFDAAALDDLIVYLGMLDGEDAARPAVELRREQALANGAVDVIDVLPGTSSLSVVYTIANVGPGILDLGNFSAVGAGETRVTIEQLPAPQLAAGEEATLRLSAEWSGDRGQAVVGGWTSDPQRNRLEWTIDIDATGDGCAAACTPTPTASPTPSPSPAVTATASPTATATATAAPGCGDDGMDCGASLRLQRLLLDRGPSRRPDRGRISLRAELAEAVDAEVFLADVSAGVDVRVQDASAAFDVSIAVDSCTVRRSGRAVVCGNLRDGARVVMRLRRERWSLTVVARNLSSVSTGALDPHALPLASPVHVAFERTSVRHPGTAADCRATATRRLRCRG